MTRNLKVQVQVSGKCGRTVGNLLSPKKSTAGADDTAGRVMGAECFSSTDTFALPRRTDVGMKGRDGFSSTVCSRMAVCVESRVSACSLSSSSSASSTVVALAE